MHENWGKFPMGLTGQTCGTLGLAPQVQQQLSSLHRRNGTLKKKKNVNSKEFKLYVNYILLQQSH